ncbi:hypothetical protein NPIL_220461 [Nephila pilipes]|uniref:Uncharacterized protein n=1 Tax=Nephila pilipes TaxID=299642 RepID=A0A8X6UKD9_NEPPI|nr:hypothetical protein NPIL_220461 [Nephila pilipes]
MLSQADIPGSSLWDLELLHTQDPIEQNSREETKKAVMFHFQKIVWQKRDGRYDWKKIGFREKYHEVFREISDIRKLTTSEDWFHTSTDQNPADILSRGCGPKQLQKRKWWQRPAGYRIQKTSGQSQL